MKKGFTLIELLVVVLIIGVLSAVALPQYQTAVERARATEALTMVGAISEAAQRYHSQHEQWPGIDGDFNKLDIDLKIVKDADNRSYAQGKHFAVYMGMGEETAKYLVEAHRSRDNHQYTIWATIEAKSNGTYSVTRACKPAENDDSEALSYCNAITGGHNDSF